MRKFTLWWGVLGCLFLMVDWACSGTAQTGEITSVSQPQKDQRPPTPQIQVPQDWKFIDSIPIRLTPDYPAQDCQTSIPVANHQSIEDKLVRYQVGNDTLYLDRTRAIFWPYGSYDGCKYLHQSLSDSSRTLLHAYIASSGNISSFASE